MLQLATKSRDQIPMLHDFCKPAFEIEIRFSLLQKEKTRWVRNKIKWNFMHFSRSVQQLNKNVKSTKFLGEKAPKTLKKKGKADEGVR